MPVRVGDENRVPHRLDDVGAGDWTPQVFDNFKVFDDFISVCSFRGLRMGEQGAVKLLATAPESGEVHTAWPQTNCGCTPSGTR